MNQPHLLNEDRNRGSSSDNEIKKSLQLPRPLNVLNRNDITKEFP